MSLGARISERLDAVGLTQADLARTVGVSPPAIHHLIQKGATGSKHLHAIARALRTSTDYLSGLTDDAAPLAFASREALFDEFGLVPVKVIDASYGMGATMLEEPTDLAEQQFPRAWMQKLTNSPPAALTWATGVGDSMEPTIHDADMILIDHSQRTILGQDRIWAFTIGDFGMVKRLRLRGDKVTILSDNAQVPPDEAHVDEINMVGRIAAIVRRI